MTDNRKLSRDLLAIVGGGAIMPESSKHVAEKIEVIAEVGSVHDGSLGNALRLIDAASACGADVVKFQTHIAEAETLRDAPMPPYFKGEPRFEYFQRTGFSLEQWKRIKGHCTQCGVEFLSSPFSIEAVELLETVGVDRYKVASGEVTNLPLLKVMAATGRPIILSSGMSSWRELDAAVETIGKFHGDLAILQCTSEYPCPYDRVGLNIMLEMKERYGLPVGLSDHTLTNYACLAAATLGASMVEKHFTFSRLMYGSDASTALEPPEFRDLVDGVRAVTAMLQSRVDKDDLDEFEQMRKVFQKSLVSLTAISAGTTLSIENIGVKKPGTGIPGGRLEDILGKKAARDIAANSVLSLDDVEW